MTKRNLKNLRLRAIAAVDNPCQEHAKALCIKRREDTRDETLDFIAKYISQEDGAHSFQECLADSKFDQNIWPCVDALSQSIRSIVGDTTLTGAERDTQIQASVDQFLSAVRDISPEVSKRLEPLVRKEGRPMPKTVEQLEADIAKLTRDCETSATALVAAEKAKTDAEAERDQAKADCNTAKAALATATEETIKVGDTEIKKSVIGPEQFALAKALADDRDTQRLEKRAGEEFRHVVGTASEKALVLKAVDSRPDDDPLKKSVLAILTAAEKMAKLGFDNLGSRGEADQDVKKARQTYEERISEIQKRDSSSRSAAMSKARTEYHDDWAAAYPDEAERDRASN